MKIGDRVKVKEDLDYLPQAGGKGVITRIDGLVFFVEFYDDNIRSSQLFEAELELVEKNK